MNTTTKSRQHYDVKWLSVREAEIYNNLPNEFMATDIATIAPEMSNPQYVALHYVKAGYANRAGYIKTGKPGKSPALYKKAPKNVVSKLPVSKADYSRVKISYKKFIQELCKI